MYRIKQYQLVMLLAVLGTAAVLLTGCGGGDEANAKEAETAAPTLTVRVETLTPRPITDAIQVAGILKAFDDVTLSAEEGGVVRSWVAEKGDRVTRGQVIALLNDDVIRAQYEAAESQYKLAQLNLDKQQKVYEEKGISELQYKNLQYGRDVAKANADLMRARLTRMRITAPVDGVLEQQYFDEGEMAPPGMPLARVVSTAKLEVRAEISEKYAGTVELGQTAVLTFDAFPLDTVRATVSYVSATVDPTNRSLTIEIVIPSRDGRYKPEMIAKVRVLRESKEDALVVSENIVQLVDMNKYIVYVENDGVAQERIVTLGGRQNGHIEVVDGLKPGDRVIVTDVQKLVDGLRIAVAN